MGRHSRARWLTCLLALALVLTAARCDGDPDPGEACSEEGEVVINDKGEELICVFDDE